MQTYTLALALEDFVPVILSALGLYIVSRMVLRVDAGIGRMATIGFALVAGGGLLKATWKLFMAASGGRTDLVWLDKGMFLWMAPGFLLLAFALWYTAERMTDGPVTQRIWLAPGIGLALMLLAILLTGFPSLSRDTWRFVLLGIMTLGNVVMTVLLIQKARRFGLGQAALLFLLNIVIVFVLSGMARIPEQTIALQWTEQALNTLAQGAFLYAAYRLSLAVTVPRMVAA
jgi:hypothetical protein